MLADFDVLRKHTETIDPKDVGKMMRYGILSAGENYSAMVPEIYDHKEYPKRYSEQALPAWISGLSGLY